jgi:hypothetical protein
MSPQNNPSTPPRQGIDRSEVERCHAPRRSAAEESNNMPNGNNRAVRRREPSLASSIINPTPGRLLLLNKRFDRTALSCKASIKNYHSDNNDNNPGSSSLRVC